MAFDLEFVKSKLPGRRLVYFDTVDTTMREAAAICSSGAPSGTAVIASEQLAGVGRHGHTWHSERNNGLYVSIVLRPSLPAQSTPTLTLALGLAALDAIQEACGIACDLRWPNDVMAGEKKTAGILAQLGESSAIAGIGVNVNHERFPPDLAEEATSLRLASGREQSRERILVALLPAADRYVSTLETRGPEPILAEFSRRSSYASGKRVSVERGDSLVWGTTAGVTDAGFLVVRKDDGTDEIILAGGVRAAGARRG